MSAEVHSPQSTGRSQTISALLDDINELRRVIAECDARILRKRIAIEEVLASGRGESVELPAEGPAVEIPAGELLTVRQMVEGLFSNGERLPGLVMRRTLYARYPEQKLKIERAFSNVLARLMETGYLQRDNQGSYHRALTTRADVHH